MAASRNWIVPFVAVLAVYLIAAGVLAVFVPVQDGVRSWGAPLIAGGWMAWTFPTAMFFLTIFAILSLMAVWEYAVPGGSPRIGVLRFETTRGDRLFISLLGSAFIHLAWLGSIGSSLWWALALSVVYAVGVFRYV